VTSTARPSTSPRRDQIATVALELFAEKGYAATSMREISEQLGITKAALYYHYTSKDEIVRELVDGMLTQVDQLVEWARGQDVTDALRLEIVTRWGDIMQSNGLVMFRFAMANQRLIESVRTDPQGLSANLHELGTLLAPPGSGVAAQLRARMALLAVNMAGIAGLGLDATDEEVFAAARQVAVELLPQEPV
jgi:AcrR family transcriptional regulator